MRHLDGILARSDPYALAQAIAVEVCTLDEADIRTLMSGSGARLGAYYRAEIARLLDGSNEEPGAARVVDVGEFESKLLEPRPAALLQSAMIGFLQSNLRALPIFGAEFGAAVAQRIPTDRAVAIGEEPGRRNPIFRSTVIGASAIALVFAGAIGERTLTESRAESQALSALSIESPAPAMIGQPKGLARTAQRIPVFAARRIPAAAAQPEPYVAAQPEPYVAAQTPQPPAPHHPAATHSAGASPIASGSATVTIAPAPLATDSSAIDVNDMPQAYSDATPLPRQSAQRPVIPGRVVIATPKPKPRRRTWIHRALMYLDPFKP